MEEFLIFFNKKKQWIVVKIWDVHPITFNNWGGGRWGYFEAKYEFPRKGLFGELHLVKRGIREDTVVHEMFHVLCAWLFAKNGVLSTRNEERMAEFLDELVGKFYKEYRKEGNNDRPKGSSKSAS